MIKITPIHPEDPKPEHNMPFAPAFMVEGGRILFLAGCGPILLYHKHPHVPAEEREWMSGGFERQIERTFANIEMVLKAAGADWSKVVKLTVYLTDMSYQNELNRWTHQIFGKTNPPPRTLIGVACLSHQDMLIEIDVTAAL